MRWALPVRIPVKYFTRRAAGCLLAARQSVLSHKSRTRRRGSHPADGWPPVCSLMSRPVWGGGATFLWRKGRIDLSTTPTATSSDSAVPTKPPSSRGRWLVVAIAIGLVAVPLLWTEVPVEIARWYCAAAAESELDDDFPKALQQVDRAIEWGGSQADIVRVSGEPQVKAEGP